MLNPRDPQGLAAADYDLAIVGGGVYGIMTALEAVRRGLRPILIERADFAAATSHNSLRIAHGGLRYLQSLDLHRFRESVAERSWLLRSFPDLVAPLPCLMPLYGDGLHRPAVLRLALAVNDLLSHRRNDGLAPARRLPGGRVLDRAATLARGPGLRAEGLRGGALWYDAFIPDTPRLLIEALHWACAHGARALNYVEARAPIITDGRIAGLHAVDTLTGQALRVRAPVVINAAGPWAPAFARGCASPVPGLYRPSLAWNVVLSCSAPGDCALAVRPPRPGGQTYFLVPWKGVLMVGTGHAPWLDTARPPRVPADLLERFLADVDAAVPDLGIRGVPVARVFAGLLPATDTGTARLSVREVIVDHGACGGPAGLFSVCGVKLTTARRVADKALERAFPGRRAQPYRAMPRPRRDDAGAGAVTSHPFDWMPPPGDNAWREALVDVVAREAVVHLDDLLLRRCDLGDNPARALALAEAASELFTWDRDRRLAEISALQRNVGPVVA